MRSLKVWPGPVQPCAGGGTLVKAQSPAAGDAPGPPAAAPAKPHKHKGLFGARHCVECQRACVKKHDGVDVPPPPSMLAGRRGTRPGRARSRHGRRLARPARPARVAIGR